MKKQIVLFLMALLPVVSWAFTGEIEIDGIRYDVITSKKFATVIQKTNPKYTGDVVIPASIVVEDVECAVTAIGDYAFYGCTGLTSVTIPSSATSIGDYAFYGCTGLTSVTIPSSVTTIEGYGFYGCRGLTSITIPSSVTSIGNSAFSRCTGLTSITIPSSVTAISHQTFQGCTGLTSITIPSSVTAIDYQAFFECTRLASVHITDLAAWCKIVFDVYFGSNPLEYAHHLFLNGEEIKDMVIPSSVTTIKGYAFYGCAGLTSVTIPSSVTTIEGAVFSGCTGLTSVTIPSSVTAIGYEAFAGCTGLTSVTIPSSVATIGERVFVGCSGLTSISVDSTNGAYDSRENSNAIIETATNMLIAGCQYSFIPQSVTSIGDQAFSGCTGLTSITIPSSVISIGNYAFSYCTGLTSVTIPSSVTTISSGAFFDCSGLTSITIPSSVTTIGNSAFSGCTELSDVYCYVEMVPKADVSWYGKDIFDGSHIEYSTLHVPASAIDTYKTTEPWSKFGTIVAIEDEDAVTQVKAVPVLIQSEGNVLTVRNAPAGTPIHVYDLSGKLIGEATASETATNVSTTGHEKVVFVRVGERSVKVRRD